MKYSFLAILICAACFCSCKKSSGDDHIVYLREKSISEVKDELRGDWQIHYKYGGMTGSLKTELPGSFLRLKANDSIDVVINSFASSSKAVFERSVTIFGYEAVIMNFSMGNWIIDHKINDTLVLTTNHVEPESYMLTRF
ncbi:MAG: hypothetical protein QM687_02860 [Ferruginibacter sp.]